MSEEHLIQAIGATYTKLPLEERKKTIRQACKQKSNRDFIKKYFPELYKEAYPNG
jgi:hypothetical protein